MVANPNASLMAGLRAAKVVPAHIFRDQARPAKAWLKAIRLHQWAKNALIFLPLLLAHVWKDEKPVGPIIGALIAFLSFGLCASATYLVNDLLDIEADRKHHTNQRRPFAAGNLSAIAGSVAVLALLAAALAARIAGSGGSRTCGRCAGLAARAAALAGSLRGHDYRPIRSRSSV